MKALFAFLNGLLKGINNFIDNKGVVWIGVLGAFAYVLTFQPKNWFWGVVLGVLGALFVEKNISWIGAWVEKQYKNIKDKIKG